MQTENRGHAYKKEAFFKQGNMLSKQKIDKLFKVEFIIILVCGVVGYPVMVKKVNR